MEENGSKGLSVAALIFGILGILCCCVGFPFAIIGLILAIIALAKRKAGKGLAVAGLITSLITLIISAIVGISMVPVMPYVGEMGEFFSDPQAAITEYEEDGTYPAWLDHMIDDGVITEEDAERAMDQMVQSVKNAGQAQ
ncbi:MAG: DUF4190 domain-containing protein [Oscillospiraceae bacterium]|nr:DUF4190 domain-containing protein [Oscillospiraceae bacterium]